jgi:hypothetical protein
MATNDYYVTLSKPIFNVVKVELRYFWMENGFNNISSPISFTITTGGGPFAVTIPAGFYSAVSLCDAITASNANVTAVIGADSYIVLTAGSTGNIVFTSLEDAAKLGFTQLSTANVSTSTWIGQEEVGIGLDPYIYLQSAKLQNNVLSSTEISSFAVIPITGQPQNIFVGETSLGSTYDAGASAMDNAYFISPMTLDRVDIRLVDSQGGLIDTRNNNNCVVVRLVHSV